MEQDDSQDDCGNSKDPIRIPVTDVLDLHTVHPRDVRAVVEEYLNEAERRNFTALRIIHGRGIGVQREIVRSILARHPRVIDFRDAPGEAGGWGATIVTLADVTLADVTLAHS
jgi:dsDNA-specific endonuclease/ATPase MutS2